MLSIAWGSLVKGYGLSSCRSVPSSGNCQFNTSEDTQRPHQDQGARVAGKASLRDAGAGRGVWEGRWGWVDWALTGVSSLPPAVFLHILLLSNPISLITIEIQRCLKHTKKKNTLDAFVYQYISILVKVTIKNGSKHQDKIGGANALNCREISVFYKCVSVSLHFL